MNLLTKGILKKLPPLYSTDGKPKTEVKAIVKFFDPCSSWTWYATEYEPETGTFFGLVKGQDTELGYFSLDELENYKGPLRIGIERDLCFKPTTLQEILDKGGD